MKKHLNFKSVYRAALVALCLMTVGVGNAWGGTKRIYCEYSDVSSWWSTIYVYAWGGEHDAKKYTMTATGTPNLVYCDIDDYHTDLLFFKSNSQTGSWETQSVDVSISSNNRWSLGDGGWGNKGTISNQQRYAPGTAIDGLVDIKNPHNQIFTDGTYSTTLEAHKTYEFKILETSTLYGLNDLIATSSISNQTLNTSGYQVRLCTAGAGTYTFAYNSSTHTLSIMYPETSHPSIDYCYVIDYSWSPSANLHLWNGTSTKVAEWNGGSTIEGSTWPGAAISNKTTIGGQSYFYIAPGEYANFLVSKSGHETDRSGDLTTSDGYGKRRYWKDASDGWIWDTFTVRIQLENDGADAGHKGTEYQDVAFNSDVLSDIMCPEKTHYDFQGYYTEVGGTGTQVIDKHGHWIASVSDYTDASIHWIHAGTSTTLYAKWTEHEYAITIAVEGSGTTSPASSTIGKIETPSGDITATPGSGYSFREWDFSKQGESDYDVWCAAGYTSTNATIRISAKRDGTLTAKFTANNYTVGLDNREADPEHGGTASVNVTYDATTGLTSAITPPQKEHYTFGGYYISTDRGATLTNIQLIDASGNWNTGVSGYIDGSKRWICAGDTMLYAQWTENLYSVTVTAGANGSVSPSSVSNIGYVTASGDITATADTGYHFVSWTLPANVPTAYSYIATSNPIRIRATASGQTITANFAATNYTVTLDNREPTTSGTTSVSVTYNATTNLTSNITPPQKEHYTFGGYFTEVGGAGTQLINADGSWIKDVTGYTSHDGDNPKWVLADDLTLYAKWTETMYPVAIAILPAGAGNVQVSGETVTEVTAGYATHSPEMTAVPANAAWVFKEWQVSSASLSMDLEHYSTTGTSMQVISVAADQTLTAVFEPRYYLVGGEIMSGEDGVGTGTSSGMPGWDNYNEPFEIVTNSPILATCSLTLGTNKNFYIMVRDKADGFSYGKSSSTLGDESIAEPITFTDQDNKVLFHSNGGTNYTFKITAVDGSGRPIVSVERPHQMHFAHKRVDIDGNDHNDDLGGTLTATINDESAAHEQWFDYGSDVNWTATAETGYSLTWYTDNAYSNAMNPQPAASWSDPDITHDENIFAKFTEKATTVTLSNDGHGKVQIGGVDKTSTTCGVTTTRELTAVPNEGYKFSSWSKSGDDITLFSTSTNTTTLSGNGSGATSGQTVTANFVERYSIKGTMNGENWGTTYTLSNIGTNAGSKDTCYVTMTLPANTTYEFAIYDEQTGGWYKAGTDAVYDMTYTNHTNWEFGDTKTYNCGITTAGKGTYKFIFNITDKTVTVVYPTSYQVNYGATVGGSVMSVLDDDNNVVPNGGYVRKGGSVTYEATASDGYTFTGWCPDDSYGNTFTDFNPWKNENIDAPSNAYAKFHSTNFVIYRHGDKSSDPRAVWDDVESYEGGTISETIEFRMKVNELDYWYTLCLPFEVNAVQVWEDGAYYGIVPYWRTEGKYYTGHYILRRPVTTTDFAIEGFEGRDRWIDPESSNVLPSKNIPYIIQWHDEYFLEKYISFFGTAGQTIPTAMDEGSYASSDETVNIYGNNSMTTGTVRDAYLLDPYYGTDGAWMREELGTDRSVLPFECFILANPATTAKYRVLRRDMADTPTGWDTVSETENKTTKVLIDNNIYIIRGDRMYTIQGTLVKEGK